jgi:hypothetical protein
LVSNRQSIHFLAARNKPSKKEREVASRWKENNSGSEVNYEAPRRLGSDQPDVRAGHERPAT